MTRAMAPRTAPIAIPILEPVEMPVESTVTGAASELDVGVELAALS